MNRTTLTIEQPTQQEETKTKQTRHSKTTAPSNNRDKDETDRCPLSIYYICGTI